MRWMDTTFAAKGFASALIVLLLSGTASGVMSQPAQRILIRATPPCSQCVVTLVRAATAGGGTDSVLASPIVRPVRDGRGRLFAPSYERTSVLVYDASGRLTGSFGRSGQGPAELGTITALLAVRGDSIIVRHGRRASLFSPSFAFVRQIASPPRTTAGMLPLPSGAIIYTSAPTDPQSLRRIFQLRGPDGDSIAAFGPLARTDPNCVACNTRALMAAVNGKFWARTSQYEFEVWGESGELLSTIAVTASPWYDTAATAPRTTPLQPPRTRIVGLVVLDSNTIAVFGLKAAESWRPAQDVKVGTGRIGGIAVTAQVGILEDIARGTSRENDTFVDVIDLSRRTIVATGRFREQTVLPLGGEFAYAQRPDSLGVVHYDVWRLSVRRQ